MTQIEVPEQRLDKIPSRISRFRIHLNITPTPRILLFFISILLKVLASSLSAAGFVLTGTVLWISGVVFWIAWFIVLFLVAIPSTDKLLRNQMHWLKPVALGIFALLLTVGLAELIAVPCLALETVQTKVFGERSSELLTAFEHTFTYSDSTALCHQATENLLEGHNPYAKADIIKALDQFNIPSEKITPLREGMFADIFPYPNLEHIDQFWKAASKNPGTIPPEVESKLSYPAGCFLLPAPFVLMGVNDYRFIYLIFVVAGMAYAAWQAPRNMRWLFIGALLICVEIWNGLADGETGGLTFPFILIAWLILRRNLWLSALLMGIALATKQVAWFFVPFYLILILRTIGLKKVLPVLGIMSSVFLIANVPFLINDPKLWLMSILAPMTDKLFPMGIGIVTLVTGGVLGIRSPVIFGLLELSVAVLAIIWYFRYCRRYPQTGLILAVLPLFFAWRSLWPYFFYIDIMILASIMINEYGQLSEQNSIRQKVLN